MNKRILTLVLAFVMVFGLAATAFAEVTVEKITNPKVQWLIDKNIVEGRLQDDGKTKVFDLDKTITREEVAKLVILYRGFESLARSLKGTKGIFSDVAIDRWSNGHINVAQTANLVKGYPDGTFKPEGEITYAEVSAILVRLNSKWTAADEKAATWPVSYIKAAEEFGILKDVKVDDANAKAVRERVFEMMYNAFDGKYQSPIANDKLGVVSRVWVDGIQINGDSKEEYKVTRNTVFIGENLNTIYSAKDFYGSLVRIAINSDKEITHMVVLGADKLAKNIKAWEGIAKDGVIKEKINTTTTPANVSKADKDEIVIDGTTLVINDNTRIFVSDKENSNFFEAKKIADAIDFKNVKHLTGVYAAYDVQAVTNVKYARVIVFSAGKEADAKKDLVRVTNNVNSAYKFMAENTKAVEKEYDIKDFRSNFPYNYGFEKMDVVSLTREGENGVSAVKMMIDYSDANVYEVNKIGDIRYQNDGTVKFEGGKIELKDKNQATQEFALSLDGTSVFTNGLPVGSHVQVAFDKDTRIITIISKVDLALKGALPAGKPGNEESGNLVKVGYIGDRFIATVGNKAYEVDATNLAAVLGATLAIDVQTSATNLQLALEKLEKKVGVGKVEISYLVKNDNQIFNIRLSDKTNAAVVAFDANAAKILTDLNAAQALIPLDTDAKLAAAKAAVEAYEKASDAVKAAVVALKADVVTAVIDPIKAELKAKLEAKADVIISELEGFYNANKAATLDAAKIAERTALLAKADAAPADVKEVKLADFNAAIAKVKALDPAM